MNGTVRTGPFIGLPDAIALGLIPLADGAKSDGGTSGLRHHGCMTDPRNVAHDKKVQQEKKHNGEEIAPGAIHAPQPGQKPALKHDELEADKDAPSDS